MAQSGEMFEEDQWDSQKENAAPRVDGKPAHEVHALAKQDGRAGRAGRAQHLQAKRAQLWHEAECSDQSADSDPLTHWLRVLELDETEQPSMASGSSYIATLEHIANLFRDDHRFARKHGFSHTRSISLLQRISGCGFYNCLCRYKNDPRYVRVWIKLVRSVPEPADALAFMEARSIGEHLALYYECKAMFLEHRGAYSAADDALSLGIAREAQPLKRLQNRHEAFLERMRRRAQREGTSLSRPDVSDRSGISTIRRFGQPLESNSEQQIQHGGPSDEFVSGITSSRAMRADSGSSSISHLSVHMVSFACLFVMQNVSCYATLLAEKHVIDVCALLHVQDEDMSATCLSASSAPQATWDYLPASAQLSKENTPGICRDWQSAAFKRKHKTGPHGASGFNDAINVFEDANEEAVRSAQYFFSFPFEWILVYTRTEFFPFLFEPAASSGRNILHGR